MKITEVGGIVYGEGLGRAIDKEIDPQEIEDPALAALWAEAQIKMNEIQLYLETILGPRFFK